MTSAMERNARGLDMVGAFSPAGGRHVHVTVTPRKRGGSFFSSAGRIEAPAGRRGGARRSARVVGVLTGGARRGAGARSPPCGAGGRSVPRASLALRRRPPRRARDAPRRVRVQPVGVQT